MLPLEIMPAYGYILRRNPHSNKGESVVLNIFAEIKKYGLLMRQMLRDAVRDPATVPWGRWLYWSFWVSLATFPIGYGAREVLPVGRFILLLFY